MGRVALAASAQYSGRREDEDLVREALSRRGLEAEPVVWDAPDDWRRFDAILIGACWDYHLRPEEFLAWVRAASAAGAAVWNPPETIARNHHKAYLLELACRDVAVVPTRVLSKRLPEPAGELFHAFGCDRLVIKPAVSASAHRTWILDADDPARDEKLRAAVAEADTLAQPFLVEIYENGERSVVFIAGEYSHSILKRPAPGEFRSQSDFGGSVVAEDPPGALVELAAAALAAADCEALYARVDLVSTARGPLLMELELIEPDLYLRYAPTAAGRLANALVARVQSR